jgi:hypothetical protein
LGFTERASSEFPVHTAERGEKLKKYYALQHWDSNEDSIRNWCSFVEKVTPSSSRKADKTPKRSVKKWQLTRRL